MGRLGCFRSNSVDSVYSYIGNNEDPNMKQKSFYKRLKLWQKILFVSGIILLIVLFVGFLIVWVIFPLVFMNNYSMQRFFTFFNFQNPKNPDFNNPQKYGIDGVVNFYITTKDVIGVPLSIGAWLVLHDSDIKTTPISSHSIETAGDILHKTKHPVVMYLHGVGCNRILPKDVYNILRKHFIIVSIDHRGYGDSERDPSELGIVNDTTQIFQWIRSKTDNDIYVWGHSLGTALSTHSVRNLKENYNIVPKGLILESPFTTMREEIPATSLGKVFSWLPWFEATVLDPLEKNGFLFKTTSNILYVDCPIMVMHAEDDEVIPYTFGKKVAEVAASQRLVPPQGNVTYHQFGRLGYHHTGITYDPNIPKYIEEFIGYCNDQNLSRG